MKRTQTIIPKLVVVLFASLVFLTPTSVSAQAKGPDVHIQTSGTLYGIWVCIAFSELEIAFPFVEENCLFFFEPDPENPWHYSAKVTGSLDALTGSGSSQVTGPFADVPGRAGFPSQYEWAGYVENGVLVLEGLAYSMSEDYPVVPVQLWVELDTGATQIVFQLPLAGELSLYAMELGTSQVSTNQQ